MWIILSNDIKCITYYFFPIQEDSGLQIRTAGVCAKDDQFPKNFISSCDSDVSVGFLEYLDLTSYPHAAMCTKAGSVMWCKQRTMDELLRNTWGADPWDHVLCLESIIRFAGSSLVRWRSFRGDDVHSDKYRSLFHVPFLSSRSGLGRFWRILRFASNFNQTVLSILRRYIRLWLLLRIIYVTR